MCCQTRVMKIVCLSLFLNVEWRKADCKECTVIENAVKTKMQGVKTNVSSLLNCKVT